MDYWIIKAEAEDKDGRRGTISCKFHERDSESTSKEECALRLMMAADRQNVKIVGPIEVVTDYANTQRKMPSEPPAMLLNTIHRHEGVRT
jgi:hypothetical protein